MLVLQGVVAAIRDGAPASVLGAVWIGDDGLVAAVTPLDAEPAGFAAAPRVAAGGVIYPGLIDLHNHLLYNTLPLWTEPARTTPWTSHAQWPRQAATYQAQVNDPAELLGKAAGRALLRYVETRAIIGGTTAIQGNPNGTPLPDGDLVRNIDSERLGTNQDFIRVRTIVANSAAQLTTYVTAVGQGRAFIYHLCEGSDPALLGGRVHPGRRRRPGPPAAGRTSECSPARTPSSPTAWYRPSTRRANRHCAKCESSTVPRWKRSTTSSSTCSATWTSTSTWAGT